MTWPSWDQNINRHSEKQIHRHKSGDLYRIYIESTGTVRIPETGTTMFIRVHVDTETLTKQYPVG